MSSWQGSKTSARKSRENTAIDSGRIVSINCFCWPGDSRSVRSNAARPRLADELLVPLSDKNTNDTWSEGLAPTFVRFTVTWTELHISMESVSIAKSEYAKEVYDSPATKRRQSRGYHCTPHMFYTIDNPWPKGNSGSSVRKRNVRPGGSLML